MSSSSCSRPTSGPRGRSTGRRRSGRSPRRPPRPPSARTCPFRDRLHLPEADRALGCAVGRLPGENPFTGAAACMRAAVLTTSPATIASPSAARAPRLTSASPVLTAIRTCSASCSCAQSRIASAARTARSGSSSWAVGAPKTAITASPMNFSTVPPWRSSSARTRAWYGESRPRTSSGSSRSACAVKPTRSTKTMVTVLRSSPPAARSPRAARRRNCRTGLRPGSRCRSSGR